MDLYINRYKDMIYLLNELRQFTRLETAFYVLGYALSGLLLFNGNLTLIMPIFLTVLFSNSAIYSYNHTTDKDEDEINEKNTNSTLNYFAFIKNAKYLSISFIALSVFSASFLPTGAFFVYLIALIASIGYSFFRIKKYFLIGNLYAALFFSSIFIMGSFAAGNVHSMFYYLPLFLLHGFCAKLRGDISDYKGDKKSNIMTIPVSFGQEKGIMFFHSLILLFLILLIVFYNKFLVMAPFLIMSSFFLYKKRFKIARVFLISSMIIMPVVLWVILWI